MAEKRGIAFSHLTPNRICLHDLWTTVFVGRSTSFGDNGQAMTCEQQQGEMGVECSVVYSYTLIALSTEIFIAYIK